MHCAVIGAGLAGLGVAYHLKKKGCKVTLFDQKGVGKGASGVASGLVDAYPGRRGIRAKYADEGISATKELIGVAEGALGKKISLQNGIVRKEWDFTKEYPDVTRVSQSEVIVESGITLYISEYLQGLFASLKGTELILQTVDFRDPLEEFDVVIYANGYGFLTAPFDLPIHFIKGQVLTYEQDDNYERSIIGKIYLAPLGGKKVHIGSTYEHHFSHTEPDLTKALSLLQPKIASIFPDFGERKPLFSTAGVRVARKESYLPLIEKVDHRRYLFTGLGSRGLLYHALYGRHLANLITS